MLDQPPYFLDSNTLINPLRDYYAFDLLPSFWDALSEEVINGSVKIIDRVRDEVLLGTEKGGKEFQWFHSFPRDLYIKSTTAKTLHSYGQVLETIRQDSLYTPKALRTWSVPTVADPWLIAAAHAHTGTIVTFEKPVTIHRGSPSSKPKIPNIAEKFGIKTIDLFTMIRILQIKLHPSLPN